MFKRLFTLFMAVILVVLMLISVFSYISIRDIMINSRMAELKKEAREIAYLAGQSQYRVYFNQVPQEMLLQWKATQVYEEFGAYIAVVDRQGRIRENMPTVSHNDPDFAAALSETDVKGMLRTALGGQDVQVQTAFPGSDGLVFIVAVPWIENEQVLGAVFIHTSAQIIRASYESLFWQVLVVMLIAALISSVAVFWYVRRITKPLTGMAAAARQMTLGDFNARAEQSSLKEVDELAQAFNLMVAKLSELEDSRKEFVANVSHELRSPLTSIRGYIEGMRDGVIPEAEHRRYLDIVSEETLRLSKLIANLLDLSRLEQEDDALHLTNFDINEEIRRVLILKMNDIEKKGIEPGIELTDAPLWAYADRDRIQQVLVNLLDNAVKFTHRGGKIAVSAEDMGNDIFVTITDDGEGILAEDREHIFDRFYTADKAHTAGKGTGLGLSICKRIMAQHGKPLTLLETDTGASFRFTLQKGEPQK